MLVLGGICFPSVSEGKRGTVVPSGVSGWARFSTTDRGGLQASIVNEIIGADGDLVGILSRYGLSTAEIRAWSDEVDRRWNLRRLMAGTPVTLSFVGGKLAELRVVVDDDSEIAVSRTRGEMLAGRIDVLPVQVRILGASGVVQSTFYDAMLEAGVPDPIISSMVDAMAWKIDFEADVHQGDYFRLLYEYRMTSEGRPLKPGRLLAAEYSGKVRSARVFLYTDESGESLYVDGEGNPVEPIFLRYPLEFTRITSAFSHSRFHPILKQRRPHEGVDFAAPSGTPVRAIGKGTVLTAGWKGGLGRTVEIDHGNGLVSVYGHLRDYRSGIRPGASVARGQIVGDVGTTGLTTGPHLHFAIFDRGRYVNPLTMSARTSSMVKVNLGVFRRTQRELARQMRDVPAAQRSAASTPPVALSDVAQARQLGVVALTL